MYFLYLDEFGHSGIWDPASVEHNHHPLFGLAGFVVRGDRARELDRAYLALKMNFFRFEIKADVARGKRPERFEWKALKNRRDLRFTVAVIDLVRRLGGHVFAEGKEKPVGAAGSQDALYGSITQRVLVSYERYLRNAGGRERGTGLIVIDRRSEASDLSLLGSAQSYLFSTSGPIVFERIMETPLLVRSDWYHGIQAADTIARAVGLTYRFRSLNEPKHAKAAAVLGPVISAAAWTNERHTSVRMRFERGRSATPGPRRSVPDHLPNPVIKATDVDKLK